ncbi:MAG: ribosomal protein L13e [Candidatus Bathyarchaeia archaeon]
MKPVVTMRSGKKRTGKGFSPDEIHKAGITATETRKLKIPIDRKRHTAHDQNIETLKAHKEKAHAEAKPKPQPAEPKKKPKM